MINISAQVSLYPLRQVELSTTIDEVLRIFQQYDLEMNIGAMSTVISGKDEKIFAALHAAFQKATNQGQMVMVVTFSNACPLAET